MPAYRWLLFDADGTLFDYDSAEAAAIPATWEGLGLEPPDDLVEVYRPRPSQVAVMAAASALS